jgi:hypothetical protein
VERPVAVALEEAGVDVAAEDPDVRECARQGEERRAKRGGA